MCIICQRTQRHSHQQSSYRAVERVKSHIYHEIENKSSWLETEPERNLLPTLIKQSLKVYELGGLEWKQSIPIHFQLMRHYEAFGKPVFLLTIAKVENDRSVAQFSLSIKVNIVMQHSMQLYLQIALHYLSALHYIT